MSGELDVPVHALDERAVQVQHVHVEGQVERPEVDEGAGEDAPPLAVRDGEGVDEVLLTDRTDASEEPAAERRALARMTSMAKTPTQIAMMA